MKKAVKKILSILLCITSILLLYSCGLKMDEATENLIVIPNIIDVDEISAKNVLSSNGLIPRVEYTYDNNISAGNVISTIPPVGTPVKVNTQITLQVSKGASFVESKDSVISWYNISQEEDNWEFSSPYILEDKLYIELSEVTFAKAIKWQDEHQKGKLFGKACINDTFDKTVPVGATYQKQEWSADESQSFTLEIPLADLNENRPTTMYIELYAYDEYENQIDININFSLTW